MKTLDQNVEELYRDQQPLHLILLNLSETVSKYKIKKVGVLPIRIVKSNVSSVGPSPEINLCKYILCKIYCYWENLAVHKQDSKPNTVSI